MTPHETESLAYWQGKVDGALEANAKLVGTLQISIDRVESKVNKVINEQSKQSGGFRVGAMVGSFAASGVLLVFAAFVTKVFS